MLNKIAHPTVSWAGLAGSELAIRRMVYGLDDKSYQPVKAAWPRLEPAFNLHDSQQTSVAFLDQLDHCISTALAQLPSLLSESCCTPSWRAECHLGHLGLPAGKRASGNSPLHDPEHSPAGNKRVLPGGSILSRRRGSPASAALTAARGGSAVVV